MRHIVWVVRLLALALILSLLQYHVSGIYGRLMFVPISGCLSIMYLLKETLKKS